MKLKAPSHFHRAVTLRPNKPESKTIQCCQHFSKQDLQGQSVAVIGLGRSGTAATRLALARGASVLAIDRNENLDPFEHDIGKHRNLKKILGSFNDELLKEADIVVVSPGVPLENYGLSSLLNSGKRVMSELDFAAEVLPKCMKILAVTGTNGKSTVATFAGQILGLLGIETFVGGNLGIPLSEAALHSLTSSDRRPFQVVVVEVSSYQLEIPNKNFCPSVAVILNLTPDHLERHKTMRSYAMTKCRLLSQMSGKKIGILPLGNQYLNEAIMDLDKLNLAWIGAYPGVKIDMDAKVADFNVPEIGCFSNLQLGAMKAIGTQNYLNAAVAALSVIALDMGIDAAAVCSTIGELRAPPHRMQIVHKDLDGVIWVDDSKATNVEATYTGLMGLREQKSVILLGGIAKVTDMQGSNGFELLIEPLNYQRGVVTFGFSGEVIHKTLSSNGLRVPCERATNLKDASIMAKTMARCGDAIVLTPGCASFDEFKNFEHRGKFFQELAFSMFIEGGFDTCISHIREPHVWGSEPELLVASHVV